MLLLPPSLEELIEENHPVRVVDRVIDKINIDGLIKTYQGGGTSSYHPRMLLKVQDIPSKTHYIKQLIAKAVHCEECVINLKENVI